MKLAPKCMSINAKDAGHSFLCEDDSILVFRADNLASAGYALFYENCVMQEFHAPKLKTHFKPHFKPLSRHPNRSKLLGIT